MHTHTGRQPHTTLLDLELESRKVGKYFFHLHSRADTTSLESRPVLSGGVCVAVCVLLHFLIYEKIVCRVLFVVVWPRLDSVSSTAEEIRRHKQVCICRLSLHFTL